MKKIILSLTVLSAFFACQQESVNNEQPSSELRNVTIITRSASDLYPLKYPVQIYVYNSSGAVAASQTLESEDDNITVSLSTGAYSVSAVSGSTDYTAGYSEQPLMIGKTNVTVSNVDVLLDLKLYYAVASLDVNVLDVPSSVSNVSVMVSPQYSTVTNTGEYSGATPVNIPCKANADGSWSTGTVHVLPGSSEKTLISFVLTYPEGVSNYQITYPSPLMAATPYHFACSYNATHSLSCSLSAGTWNDDIFQTFQFGQEVAPSEGGGTETPSDKNPSTPGKQDTDVSTVITVDAIPSQGTIVNGHAVAVVEGDKGLLVSLKDWESITSSTNATTPTAAADALAAYSESGLTGWSIPTEEQATKIMTAYADNTTLTSFNTAIKGAKGTALLKTDSSKANVRYLCENATRTFSFVTYSTTSAGAKSTYHLRGVKEVKFKVE